MDCRVALWERGEGEGFHFGVVPQMGDDAERSTLREVEGGWKG